jgi:Reverse transcriptase (RNA-dependent DNA polymerase)
VRAACGRTARAVRKGGRRQQAPGLAASPDPTPAKPPNNAGRPAAEVVEERGLAEGNTGHLTRPGRRAGPGVPSGLDRVREVARKDKDARFTALLHHVDLSRLWAAYVAINPKAAPGVDQVTWDAYGQNLRGNLEDLLHRAHSGAYRASPSRRAYIPKADGRPRPLGIATLEDKIVQQAVVEVLNAIYEEDFLGFSYGFRPGRGPHDALDALTVGTRNPATPRRARGARYCREAGRAEIPAGSPTPSLSPNRAPAPLLSATPGPA